MTVPGLKRLGSGSIAAMLSLALHTLLLVPLVTGSSRGFSAHATRTPGRNAESPGVWIVLDDSSAPKVDAPSRPTAISPAALALTEIAIGDPHVEIPGPEESVVSDAADPEQVTSDAVPPYVRYMGEVTARIQRLWAVPSAKNSADFHCRALIRRGPAGEVQDLTLQPCDEDPALQASVLKAIRLATPLPARPDPPAEMLTLDFAVFSAKAEGRSSSVQPATADSRL